MIQAAMELPGLQSDYDQSWQGFDKATQNTFCAQLGGLSAPR